MSTGLYDQFKTDNSLETQGIILNYGKNAKGENIDIRIARAGGHNTKFSKVAEQILKPYRRQLANESVQKPVIESLMHQIYAKAVVLAWSGVEDQDGNPLPCTEANVIKLFTDLPDLYNDIREAAEKLSLFRKEALEDESKNS